jgi:7-cyano-7-deazaguanine synthase
MTRQKAIVLLSGGLDSATCLAIAHNQNYALHTLTFDYGQRHGVEVQSAQALAEHYQVVSHTVFPLALRMIGGSALTSNEHVPKKRDLRSNEIPITYVPARNTVFLSIALALAEVKECDAIFIGVNAIDYSGYPDCRPEFIRAFEDLAAIATKAGVNSSRKLKIHTPLINYSKAEIVVEAARLNVPFALTWSCYDPQEGAIPCGECDACRLRAEGFAKAGLADPIAAKPNHA